jgi:DnaJ-class molecular chaperone
MTDHYAVLGVDRVSSQEDVAAAFERLLAARKAHRQKTSDLHVAYAILADAGLRRAYDLACFGAAASDRIVEARTSIVGYAQDVVADIDVQDLARQAGQVALKALVLTSGATARAAELTARVSRAVQVAASRGLKNVL